MPPKKPRRPSVTRGRPRAPKQLRQWIRYEPAEMKAWRVAAARAGLALTEWLSLVANSEALKPVHAKPLGGGE